MTARKSSEAGQLTLPCETRQSLEEKPASLRRFTNAKSAGSMGGPAALRRLENGWPLQRGSVLRLRKRNPENGPTPFKKKERTVVSHHCPSALVGVLRRVSHSSGTSTRMSNHRHSASMRQGQRDRETWQYFLRRADALLARSIHYSCQEACTTKPGCSEGTIARGNDIAFRLWSKWRHLAT